jgi:hypothetical protein
MRIWGSIMIFIGGFMMTWPMSHAIGMYRETGDERWLMTIIGAPIMGAILMGLGFALRRLRTR